MKIRVNPGEIIHGKAVLKAFSPPYEIDTGKFSLQKHPIILESSIESGQVYFIVEEKRGPATLWSVQITAKEYNRIKIIIDCMSKKSINEEYTGWGTTKGTKGTKGIEAITIDPFSLNAFTGIKL